MIVHGGDGGGSDVDNVGDRIHIYCGYVILPVSPSLPGMPSTPGRPSKPCGPTLPGLPGKPLSPGRPGSKAFKRNMFINDIFE